MAGGWLTIKHMYVDTQEHKYITIRSFHNN